MTPKVSVIIPTFNRSALVKAAINSVLEQTFSDFELIVVDDGSTDDTQEQLRPYLGKIRYFYQANRGVSAAQNAGLREARGEWVAILASDDLWRPTKLQCQLEALGSLGAGFGACFTDCWYTGNPAMTFTAFEEAGLMTDNAYGPLYNPLLYLWERKYALYVQSLLVLRSLVNQVGGFDETLMVSEDRDLIFRLSFHTKFCYVSTPLVSIDRTDAIPRLSSSGSEWDRHAFRWNELSLKKLLAFRELRDREIREIIRNELLVLYYNRAAEGIRDFRPSFTIESLQAIHGMGRSLPTILWTLLARAARKLMRRVRK